MEEYSLRILSLRPSSSIRLGITNSGRTEGELVLFLIEVRRIMSFTLNGLKSSLNRKLRRSKKENIKYYFLMAMDLT